MPLEEFVERGARARFGFPTVTLMKSGALGMNAAAYHELEEPQHVVLAYDSTERVVGIRKAREYESHAYPVRAVSADAWYVPGRAFFRYYDIALTQTVAYRASMQDNYIIVKLTDTPVHKSGRGQQKKAEDNDEA